MLLTNRNRTENKQNAEKKKLCLEKEVEKTGERKKT